MEFPVQLVFGPLVTFCSLGFAEVITFNWPLDRSKDDPKKRVITKGGKWVGRVGEGCGRFRRLIGVVVR